MCNLMTELGYNVKSAPTVLHMDNNSAMAVAKNPEHFGRLKHLDLCYHWLRNAVTAGMITPEFCPTEDMPADILTKALARIKVIRLRSLLGLEE